MSTNIRIYAAGGCGINIASWFEQFKGKDDISTIEVCYLDTSEANLKRVDSVDTYLVKGGSSGSGKIQRTNLEPIRESVCDMLVKFPPAQLNIVISSASGGSGSVINILLVKELLAQDQNVVTFLVGSTGSAIEIDNTTFTIRSYERAAKDSGKPIVCHYLENGVDGGRTEVNTRVHKAIVRLAGLFASSNEEIDATDLRNFLDYTKHSKTPPHMVALEFGSGQLKDAPYGRIIAVATLAHRDQEAEIEAFVDYHTTGVISDDTAAHLQLTEPLHFVIIEGLVEEVYQKIAERQASVEKARKARIDNNKSLSRDASGENDTGLIV